MRPNVWYYPSNAYGSTGTRDLDKLQQLKQEKEVAGSLIGSASLKPAGLYESSWKYVAKTKLGSKSLPYRHSMTTQSQIVKKPSYRQSDLKVSP